MRFLSAPTVLLELARASRNQQVPPEYEPNAARLRNHSARIQQRHWKCKLKSTNVAAKAAATISQPRIWTDWAVSSYCAPLARARPEAARTGGADAIAAVLARAVHQPVDLALGEIASLDCQVYDAWGAFLGCRFHAGKPCLRVSYCIGYMPLLHSKGRSGCMERIAIAIQDGGGRGGCASREPTSFCLAAEPLYEDPR